MMDDDQLLEAWGRGDPAAGSQLFERHYSAVVRFFSRKIGGDPADLIQETFEECVRCRDRVFPDSGFRAFLFGIAYNVLRRHFERLRKHGERIDPAAESAADLCPGPVTMTATRQQQRRLLVALRRIPLEQQVLLELFYWEDMTSASIAEVLGLPHGTIRSRLRRARQQLQTALGEIDCDPRLRAETAEDLVHWRAQLHPVSP